MHITKPLTRQETFDVVARHLLKQNTKCARHNGTCLYRLGQLRCAAGCLLDDERYARVREDDTVDRQEKLFREVTEDTSLLMRLQDIHDQYEPAQWRSKLKVLARDVGLNDNVLFERAKLTSQQLFDKVARHLLTQKVRSSLAGMCRYREGQLRCAAGCLLDDENYARVKECSSVCSTENEPVFSLLVENINLLAALQDVHDQVEPNEWFEELRQLGQRYSLELSVLDDFIES